MKFDNVLTRMLGVKYPIIQGAFGIRGMGSSSIAVPVSEAGGLGILTSISYNDPDEFQQDIRDVKSRTEKPFAVNFTLFKDRNMLDEYHEEYVQVALKEGVPTVFTSAYDGSNIGRRFKAEGCNWIHKCATIEHALSTAKKGVDAIVIVGLEGTGFKSPLQNSTLINMTTTRRLTDVPLIAAGGIGDARGFVAALAMGAVGIYLGTAIMATKEFQASDTIKNMIVKQSILDAEHRRKIYRMEHGGGHSLAANVVDSIPTVKEFIDTIIAEAEGIITEFKEWGMLE
jgi:NAD(P)H-dependent flavin oxidoreductase YrpB (nitropropane dioxygenase family)